MQSPGFGIDEILPRPQDGTLAGAIPRFFTRTGGGFARKCSGLSICRPRPQREAEREAGRGGEIGDLGSVNLMQRRPREPAVQGFVQPRHAEADPPGGNRPAPQGGL